MAVNFAEMPVTDGLSNGFDGTNAESVTSDSWVNQIGSTNFILQNAEYSDGVISLTGDNVGYLPITEPDEYTAYFLCRAKDVTPTRAKFAQIFGTRDANRKNYVSVSIGTSDTYKIRSYHTSAYIEPTLDNWHLLTLVRTGGYFYVYADGSLLISEANTYTTRGDKFMVKSISAIDTTPTVDEAITVQMKCCVIFNTAHSAAQIKLNSDWLLVQYGFMSAPLDSKMSGADAAAIAWVIARNMEQTASLAAQKKAYRKGIKKGSDGEAEIDETWETPDSTIDLPVDEDGGVNEDDYIDLNKGIQLMYANPDDPTDTVTVKFWLDHSQDGDIFYNAGATYEKTGIGLPTLTAYYADGTEKTGTYFRRSGGTVYHHEYHKSGGEKYTYPRYITKYRVTATSGGVNVIAYIVTPKYEGWTDGTNNALNTYAEYITLPGGYVYVGAKNYDSTATTEV